MGRVVGQGDMGKRGFRDVSGFTLIEMLVTVVVVGVLLTVAAPAFLGSVNENETRTQAMRLASSLNLARSEAAKENVPVVLCPSTDSATCSADETDLRDGWLVFADRDDDNTLDSDELIQIYHGLPRGYSVRLKNDSAQVSYFPDGSTSGEEVITTCPPNDDDKRAWSVIVRPVGSPRLSRPVAGVLCS
ncbi:MAG: prepilin-type N-terminal cleavage/methylation domain-containing protein [Halioglobus sp.]|nr:prepilin-type N-terminal cleavage/methylation domain-containing protein [Halioglobus sp.]